VQDFHRRRHELWCHHRIKVRGRVCNEHNIHIELGRIISAGKELYNAITKLGVEVELGTEESKTVFGDFISSFNLVPGDAPLRRERDFAQFLKNGYARIGCVVRVRWSIGDNELNGVISIEL
jgi:hypothetical protein